MNWEKERPECIDIALGEKSGNFLMYFPRETARMKTMTMAPAHPTFYRSSEGTVIAGVAAGLARHLRVKVDYIRVFMVLLGVVSSGIMLLYALLWIFGRKSVEVSTTNSPDPDLEFCCSRFSKTTNYLLVAFVVFGQGILKNTREGSFQGVEIGLIIFLIGTGLAWYAYDRSSSKFAMATLILGATLVFVGILILVMKVDGDGRSYMSAVIAVLLTLVGVAVLATPFVLRTWENIKAHHEETLRKDEREAMANRIHDSVLQTLALIQKCADDPEAVRRIARGQERELRQWLFAPNTEETLFGALARGCGEVEDLYGIRIVPVTVGEDLPLDQRLQSIVLAAREAMVNAAKHAGVHEIDVYAECLGNVEIYVRDRGCGFDPLTVSEDRHGVRDSIMKRVQNAGGEVHINSEPGRGTEVALSMPE